MTILLSVACLVSDIVDRAYKMINSHFSIETLLMDPRLLLVRASDCSDNELVLVPVVRCAATPKTKLGEVAELREVDIREVSGIASEVSRRGNGHKECQG